MTESEQGACLIRLLDRRKKLERDIALLNTRAEGCYRAILLVAEYLKPVTEYVDPEFGDIHALISTKNYPSLEEANSLISEIGDKKNELYNVVERLKRICA